jgi:3-deoxy-D-manno-octulosonic-acid transferase
MFLYRLLAGLAFPLVLLYLLARAVRDKAYRRGMMQRFGWLPGSLRQTAPGAIWLHAVSVGEALSAVELVRRLRARLPGAPVFVSVTTVAGREVARQKLVGLADGIFYAPLDYCFAVRRVLRRLRPRAVVVLETEIWPNLWREAKRAGCALVVVNGRISDRAWPRYRRWRRFFGPVLALADVILAQDERSGQRYLELGTPAERVSVGGNLKFDFDPGRLRVPEAVAQFLARTAPEEVWIAASTMPPAEEGDPDEDEVVVEAFRQLAERRPRLLLILAPRRPERFEPAARRLEEAGVAFVRRSQLDEATRLPLPGVLLLDSIGELAALFQAADVVFMGGTLARRGGHNILEPGAFGRAIIVGPHMENFPAVIEEFRRREAVLEISSAPELSGAVERVLEDGALRERLGQRAREAAAAQQGATERAVQELAERYAEAVPRRVRAWPWRVCLWALSLLWRAGGVLKRAAGRARRVKLPRPVISIGGLSMGGAGKTSFTVWLAQRLAERGYRPAVLLRGYRRRGGAEPVALAPKAQAPVEITGDEAQIHLRAGVAVVGIGRDRAKAGAIALERFQPDLFLLDDGFQHARLDRDLDIVLVDALDPGDEVFPLGRLREPLSALSRAGVIVISHSEALPHTGAVERLIRRYNQDAPVHRARRRPKAWVEAASGARRPAIEPPFARPAAFCGLGQPASFWRSLDALGLRTVWRAEYPDHHRYRVEELCAIVERARGSGADALVTTEKDLVNLPEGWQAQLEGLPLYWLETELEVEEAESLLELVTARLRR